MAQDRDAEIAMDVAEGRATPPPKAGPTSYASGDTSILEELPEYSEVGEGGESVETVEMRVTRARAKSSMDED